MNCKGFFAFMLFANIALAAHIYIPGDINAIEIFTETAEINSLSDLVIISDSDEPKTGGREDYSDQEQDYATEESEYYPGNPDDGTPDYYDDYYDSYYYDEKPRGSNENM